MRKLIWAFALPLFLAVTGGAFERDPPTDFNLKDLKGNMVKLSDFRGRAVLINFWATWCVPCKDEMPDLVELYRKYKDKGFEILGVSLDKDRGKVAPFVKELKVDYKILFGDAKLAQQWAIRGVPASFFVNREGKITHFFFGPRKRRDFEEEILKILH
jgi:peroxiredoxin